MNRKLIAVLLILFLATLACGLDSSVPFPGDLQSQVDYLNAIHFQIGGNRLALWISLLINGFNLESYAAT
jgi:thioredoxin-related protein